MKEIWALQVILLEESGPCRSVCERNWALQVILLEVSGPCSCGSVCERNEGLASQFIRGIRAL